jgi:hypothetical protein
MNLALSSVFLVRANHSTEVFSIPKLGRINIFRKGGWILWYMMMSMKIQLEMQVGK